MVSLALVTIFNRYNQYFIYCAVNHFPLYSTFIIHSCWVNIWITNMLKQETCFSCISSLKSQEKQVFSFSGCPWLYNWLAEIHQCDLFGSVLFLKTRSFLFPNQQHQSTDATTTWNVLWQKLHYYYTVKLNKWNKLEQIYTTQAM